MLVGLVIIVGIGGGQGGGSCVRLRHGYTSMSTPLPRRVDVNSGVGFEGALHFAHIVPMSMMVYVSGMMFFHADRVMTVVERRTTFSTVGRGGVRCSSSPVVSSWTGISDEPPKSFSDGSLPGGTSVTTPATNGVAAMAAICSLLNGIGAKIRKVWWRNVVATPVFCRYIANACTSGSVAYVLLSSLVVDVDVDL